MREPTHSPLRRERGESPQIYIDDESGVASYLSSIASFGIMWSSFY